MSKAQELELNWIGKENRPKLDPRILLENPTRSNPAVHRPASADVRAASH
jgi:adenine-specific DNA-methyltransferase